MTMQIGFLGDEGSNSTTTNSSRLTLNALEIYTLEVPATPPMEIVSGGVTCDHNGDTYQIAVYDITDGVDGASLVTSYETVIPVSQVLVDGTEDTYETEFGPFLFDITPVDLVPYAGRTLAVAARFTTTNSWAAAGFVSSNAMQFSGGSQAPTDPFSTTDEGTGGYSPRSGAVFVEVRQPPEGKKLTIVSEAHADLTQTIYKKFPDHTPAVSDIFEYDEAAQSGCSVEILTDGTFLLGPGSTASDQFSVKMIPSVGVETEEITVTLGE